MNRRGFLGMLAAAAAAPALAEPARAIFLPPAGGWVTGAGGIMKPADFRQAIADGLNEAFRGEYGDEWVNRYEYRTYALGYTIVEEDDEVLALPEDAAEALIRQIDQDVQDRMRAILLRDMEPSRG